MASHSNRARALGVALVVSVAAGSMMVAVQAQQPRTVAAGVYSEAQAARGEAIYQASCATCHGPMLEGAQGPPLTGVDFLRGWSGPLSNLVNKIHDTMPADDPGKLTRPQTADLVAYMLKVARFPSGQAELSADEAVLKGITFPAEAARVPAAAAPAGGSRAPVFPPVGNLAAVMRGILFPSSNLIFTVQKIDPAAPRAPYQANAAQFSWADWGAGIYSGWELVDYAAVALAESAPLMLTPGRRCENGKPVPVDDPEWIKFSIELADAGKAALKASQTRNKELVSDVTDQIATSCSNCHGVYRDKRTRGPINTADPSNKAARCVK